MSKRSTLVAEDQTALLASIVDSSEDAITAKTTDGIVTSWNRGAERVYGYSAEEILGRPVAVLIPPDRPDDMDGILAKVRNGERVEHYETVRRRKDGKLIDISLTVSPIYDSAGILTGVSSIARDITDRKLAQDRVRAGTQSVNNRTALLASIVDSSDDAITAKTPEGIFTSWNRGAERIYGYTAEEIIGKPVAMLIPPDRPDAMHPTLATTPARQPVEHS